MVSLAVYFCVVFLTAQSVRSVSVRLADGRSDLEGRVEVNRNGVWGTICDDGWTLVDADVVCRQLGFSYARSYFRYAEEFGPGSGPIWMDDVRCGGEEADLRNCAFSGWNTSNCAHAEDAGVVCAPVNAADAGYKCNCSNATSSVTPSLSPSSGYVEAVQPTRQRDKKSSMESIATKTAPSFCTGGDGGIETWHIVATTLGGFFVGVVLTVVAIVIRDKCCFSSVDDDDAEKEGSGKKRRSLVFSFRRSRSSMKENPLYGRNANRTKTDAPTKANSGVYSYAYDHVGPKSPAVSERHVYDSLQQTDCKGRTLQSPTDSQYNRLFAGDPSLKRSESREPYCTLDSLDEKK